MKFQTYKRGSHPLTKSILYCLHLNHKWYRIQARESIVVRRGVGVLKLFHRPVNFSAHHVIIIPLVHNTTPTPPRQLQCETGSHCKQYRNNGQNAVKWQMLEGRADLENEDFEAC